MKRGLERKNALCAGNRQRRGESVDGSFDIVLDAMPKTVRRQHQTKEPVFILNLILPISNTEKKNSNSTKKKGLKSGFPHFSDSLYDSISLHTPTREKERLQTDTIYSYYSLFLSLSLCISPFLSWRILASLTLPWSSSRIWSTV